MSWSPTDYQFQPYELQAQRLPSADAPTNSDIGKRKGGRQRRSSILCQVRPSPQKQCTNPRYF
jgi:hypothetical protein